MARRGAHRERGAGAGTGARLRAGLARLGGDARMAASPPGDPRRGPSPSVGAASAPWEEPGLGPGLGALWVPARPRLLLLSWAKVTRKPRPRRAEREERPLPPKPHEAGIRASCGRRGQQARLRASSCRTAIATVEAPRGKELPAPPSPRPGPGSQEPATSTHPRGFEPRPPFTCCRDLGPARPRGRGGSPGPGAQRRQPRGGGGRCSPAQRPGPRADPSVPLCAQGCPTLSPGSCGRRSLGAEAKLAQPAGRGSLTGLCRLRGYLLWFCHLPQLLSLPTVSLP